MREMKPHSGQKPRLAVWNATACVLTLGLGVFWIQAGGETPVGVWLLTLGALSVPGVFAAAAIQRRIDGDPRPLLDQPVFRFQSLIFAVAAVAFVAIGFWSRRVGGEAAFSEIAGFFFGGLLAGLAAMTGIAQWARRRAAKQAPTST